MRIKSLEINNFKAIKNIKLNDLSDFIVIAGPNGCGKSCIFDAIRFLKSQYGEYSQNEIYQFFDEFLYNYRENPSFISTFFNDLDKPVKISMVFSFTKEEKDYLTHNFAYLINNQVLLDLKQRNSFINPLARKLLGEDKSIQKEAEALFKEIKNSINDSDFLGEVTINKDFTIKINENSILSMFFSIYDPNNIGIFDYHSSQRIYQRERLDNVNLNLKTSKQNSKQFALYNINNKYSNIKNELATSYINNLLVSKALGLEISQTNLNETLKELFKNFIPDKEFLGPTPTEDGRLLFLIKTSEGQEHDIDDLSSGEKEVLYGYLRLHNLSPKNSIIMLDEPELHLNPRMIQGLPQFYNKHIGSKLNNQIWLLTHSDALLRESLSNNSFTTYHMDLPQNINTKQNQIRMIDASIEFDRAIIDLIGDLATYKPDSKILIIEGGGDSEFDKYMLESLFPELKNKVNIISGSFKSKVKNIHEYIKKARDAASLPVDVFSIVDRDFDSDLIEGDNQFQWDVYHIENYLLKPEYILDVINDLHIAKKGESLTNTTQIEKILLKCAKEIKPDLVNQTLVNQINDFTAKTTGQN